MEGQILSHYEILERLGGGGMGVVYRARDTRLARQVAVKVLHADDSLDHERKTRLRQEARSASSLNHPNIITIHDIDTANGVDFIAMEYVDGKSLASLIAAGPLPLDDALKYGVEMASALAAAHKVGIVHRDIKPANIMVTSSGHVKVLDFGVAKLIETAADPNALTLTAVAPTAAGVVFGTPAYMSPEQVQGRLVDARSDVFSMGTVLYEMLVGRRPFTGDSQQSVLSTIGDQHPRPLHEARRDVPTDFELIVSRCLEKEPGKRYPSATMLLVDLAQCQARLAARRIALLTALRRPSVAIATAVIVAALASAAGWWVVYGSRVRWARQTALPEIARLADREDFDAAFRLLREAERYIPDDPAIRGWRERTSVVGSVQTQPEGADVYVKDYRASDRSWFFVGRTPLETDIPLEYLRWRIVKAGFEPLEWASLVQPGMYGAERYQGGPDRREIRYLNENPRTPAAIVLTPVADAQPGMIRVPSGQYMLGTQRPVELDDYWLDRYEVTNADFKRFVDSGGYSNDSHWVGPVVQIGTPLSSAQRAGEFRDKTGRPGPSTWVLSTFPEGQAELPVSGVSWYEAVAYCAFAGKKLPTIYQWYRASGRGSGVHQTWSPILGFSNFDGTAPVRGGQFAGLAPYGTYDMAGNVKEWVWNAIDETRRYFLGGAWNDPSYTFTIPDAAAPLSRLETYGFRCAKSAGALSDADPLLGPVPFNRGRDYTTEKPVNDHEFDLFRGHYVYDRTDLNSALELVDGTHQHWSQEKVTFDAGYRHERISAHLFLPRNARPPYQTVLYFPAGGAFFPHALLQMRSLDFIVQSGRAAVYPIFQNTHERYRGTAGGPAAARELRLDWFKDLARTLDYLETRADIDRDRIAMYGFSTFMLPIFHAFEPRLKTGIAVGGMLLPGPSRPEVDPFHFAPRVTVPFLMLNGRNDAVHPVETRQVPLFRLLGTPAEHKRHVTFDSHHVPPRWETIKEILDWLDRYLGPVSQQPPGQTPTQP